MQASSMKFCFHRRTFHAVITMIKQYSHRIFILLDEVISFFIMFQNFYGARSLFFLWSLYFCFMYDKYLKYIGNMKDIRRLSTIVITSVVYF